MAALTANDVTFIAGGRSAAPSVTEDSTRTQGFGVMFGNGALTYPANGIPLSKLSKLGFPYIIQSVIISSMGTDGYLYKYDAVNNTLRVYQEADAAGALAELGALDVVPTALLTIVVTGH